MVRLIAGNSGELAGRGLEDLRLAGRKSSLKPHQNTKTLAGTLIDRICRIAEEQGPSP